MTADAKVGLLLGLIFIVIIAFLVNGLPAFFRGTDEAFGTTVAELPVPNLILERVQNNSPAGGGSIPLRQVPPPSGEVVVQIPPAAIPDTGPQETVAAREAAAAREVISANETAAVRQAAGVAAVVPPRAAQYTVKDGEYLTTIAQKIYGIETGKKKSTLEAIATASGLKSVDVLQVGQVLVLPDLNADGSVQKPRGQGSNPLLENYPDQLEKVTARRQADTAPRIQPAPQKADYIEHTVKSGESLSQISSRYLGTAKRVDEIVKMNPRAISHVDDIMAGMVLKLPKK